MQDCDNCKYYPLHEQCGYCETVREGIRRVHIDPPDMVNPYWGVWFKPISIEAKALPAGGSDSAAGLAGGIGSA